MQPSTALGKKHLLLLGKLVAAKRPDVASELITAYFPKSEPFERDYGKIGSYYLLFCEAENILPDDFLGPLYKTHKVDRRRLFISVILHLYHPDVFSQSTDDLLVGYGFCRKTAAVLKISHPGIWKMIREAVRWEKLYDDYREKAEMTTQKIKELTNGGA